MTRKGKWSGRLTPRHLRRRLSRHAFLFQSGKDGRWPMSKLTAGERETVARTALNWAVWFELKGKTWSHVRALRATYWQYGLVCEEREFDCDHGRCRVCDDQKYPTAQDEVCDDDE